MRRTPIAALMAIVAVIAVLLDGRSAATALGVTPQTGALEAAMEWRQSHALRADREYVLRSFADESVFSEADLGLPLTADEWSEMVRRAEIQQGKQEAVEWASAQAGFAGVYTDHARRGVLVFLFAGKLPELPSLQRVAPVGAEVEIRAAERSLDELLELKKTILEASASLAETGVEVVSVGIRTHANAVIVGISEPDAKSREAIEREFGPAVEVREDHVAEADACTSNSNCWPPKGGFHMRSTNGTPCTSGWMVKRTDTSTRQILTAGHCSFRAGGVGSVWEHGVGGPDIGTSQSNTYNGTGSHASDVGLIGIYSSISIPNRNQFIAGTVSGAPVVAAVDSYFLSSAQNENDLVCRYGITSLRDCGEITDVDVAHISRVQMPDGTIVTKTIDRTWEVNFDSAGGDSGGPIFALPATPSAAHIAFGTHVHSAEGYDPTLGIPGWYSPYDIGRNDWQALTGLMFNICLSASCP